MGRGWIGRSHAEPQIRGEDQALGRNKTPLCDPHRPQAGCLLSPTFILTYNLLRDFAALHGSGANKACNILFADTNVKTIYDTNGDSYINPGFPVTPTAQPGKEEQAILAAVTGYTNNKCESAPAEFYNGPVLDNSIITKTVFETN